MGFGVNFLGVAGLGSGLSELSVSRTVLAEYGGDFGPLGMVVLDAYAHTLSARVARFRGHLHKLDSLKIRLPFTKVFFSCGCLLFRSH